MKQRVQQQIRRNIKFSVSVNIGFLHSLKSSAANLFLLVQYVNIANKPMDKSKD
jgi:hypothetical protein